jgi:hypothetical protein
MLQTTGIGSLPHAQVDAAVNYAFRFDVPFYPQIPLRGAGEYMIPQALESLPGAHFGDDGMVSLDRAAFLRGRAEMEILLGQVIEGKREWIYPPEHFSCWAPFLFELSERKVAMAKTQMAGPLTCQWVISGSSKLDAEVGGLVTKLITAKALTMVRQLRVRGVQPVFFLDEPALYAYDGKDPLHVVALQDLRILLMVLRKEGALVGLHCCSNTDWKAVLGLGLDFVSFDVALSAGKILAEKEAVSQFLKAGGSLSYGLVPTDLGAGMPSAQAAVGAFYGQLRGALGEAGAQQAVRHCFVTPACGLALKTVEDAEGILARVNACKAELSL